jgi:2-polyprenyl-6-methoxyphenol hydroxylase-like FAD-dependent oxidoreductase
MLLAHIPRHHSQARYGGVTASVRQRDSAVSEAVRADYLIAADGVHSPIRNGPVRPDGFVAWRTGVFAPSPERRLDEAMRQILHVSDC